ncbi:MAG: FUSC family protein [Nocardioides sp.]
MFAFGAVASVPHRLDQVPVAVGVALASALFVLVVGNVGAFVRRGPRTAPVRLAPALTWAPVRNGVAALVAGAIGTGVGIGHPYWATVAAVAPLSARGIGHQLVRAGHRVVGTLLGLIASATLLVLHLGPVPTVLVVVLLQIATELLVGRNYVVAMVFITPMALLMGQLAAPRPVGVLLFDRGVETAIGAAVAIALVGQSVVLAHRQSGS